MILALFRAFRSTERGLWKAGRCGRMDPPGPAPAHPHRSGGFELEQAQARRHFQGLGENANACLGSLTKPAISPRI
jgi:hypothetical protein